ncbi:MAG: hypothetical protein NUV68_04500 [Caldiserica bacterium]|jgi:hypothetical protein|nr:hypothetical protein [Caldisericota bacterium]MDH7562196.1 hypothetical protein [Caldisericota bacterium]
MEKRRNNSLVRKCLGDIRFYKGEEILLLKDPCIYLEFKVNIFPPGMK